MLPVWTFILITIAELWGYAMKKSPRVFAFILKFAIFFDVIS